MDEPGDIELWENHRRGACEPSALAILIARHQSALTKFCVHLTGNAEAAAELVQETIVKILVTRPEIRERFSGYLKAVATRIWLNNRKKAMRLRPLDAIRDIPAPLALDGPERDERHALLLKALDQLTDQERACVVLYLAQEYTYREIAELLGRSITRCKQLTDRGLQTLREFFDAHGGSAL